MRHLKKLKRHNDTRVKELKLDYERNKFDFVITELELGTTFAETALSSESNEKAERNVRHARRAYQTAGRFRKDSSFTPEMNKMVAEKTERLRELLESFHPSA